MARRRTFNNILLLLMAVALCVIVAEAALRLSWKGGGIYRRTGFSSIPFLGMNLSYWREVDSPDNFAELQQPGSKIRIVDGIPLYHDDFSEECGNKSGRFRIILLGDSVILGVNKPYVQESEAMGSVLQQRLSSLDSRFQVLVFARGGYNLPQIGHIFENEIPGCDPDIVIYGFCQNDINSYRVERLGQNLTVIYSLDEISYLADFPGNKALLRYSYLYRLANKGTIGLMDRLGIRHAGKSFLLYYDDSSAILERMESLSGERGIPLLIVEFPYVNRYKDYESNGFLERLRQEKNISYYDIRKEFISRGANASLLTIDEAHFTRYGNSAVADILYDYITSLDSARRFIDDGDIAG